MKITKIIVLLYLSIWSYSSFSQDILGNIATTGTLKVSIWNTCRLGVDRYTSGAWQNQWFFGDSKGYKLYADGVRYKHASGYFTLGTQSRDPELFGFDFYGIKQDEKILNTDVRKVGVVIKKAYTSNQVLTPVTAYYRIYVNEGTTEVQVQDWTQINRASNEYYFIFDTKDKIPNEYNVDIKVLTSGEVDTYKKTLTFQIVNKK